MFQRLRHKKISDKLKASYTALFNKITYIIVKSPQNTQTKRVRLAFRFLKSPFKFLQFHKIHFFAYKEIFDPEMLYVTQ